MATIGRYEILGELKRGGQGVVYRAFDPLLHDQVAIKVLPQPNDSLSASGDHLREARIAVRLDHPNIVRVRDANEDQGRLYIVMELLTGRSLDLVIQDSAFSIDRRIEIARQVCDGLRYAHAHEDRIIHRDIKPKNIMVLDDGRVKIIDFGIAKALSETRRPDGSEGKSRFQGWGTLPYMSPEQLAGKSLDQRTDIFSFGVVLYELLARHRPFEGKDDAEIANKIQFEAPPPIVMGDPVLQGQARTILARCLAKKPEDRYPDCAQILTDLSRMESGSVQTLPAAARLEPEGSFVGRSIGKFHVISLLGAGAMGEVYKAQDTSNGNAVALKFVKPELVVNPEAMKRFVREGQARIRHHNVCQVYGCEEYDGRLFMCMEYCEGEDLQKKMGGGVLDWHVAIDYCLQIADGLDAIHGTSIVHRDIKPTNVIVKSDGALKIVDFGVAKFLDQTALTESGVRVGSPAYMSPEQTLGKSIDHRSDIWALGVVLYELVSGTRPFPSEALAYSILNVEPQPLPATVPSRIAQVVGKALQKNPVKRYATVAEMGADLRLVKRKEDKPPVWPKLVAALALLGAIGLAINYYPSGEVDPVSLIVVADADCRLVSKNNGDIAELRANRPDTLKLASAGTYSYEVRPKDYPCFDTTFAVADNAKAVVRTQLPVAARFARIPRFSLLVNAFLGETLDNKVSERVVINDYARELNEFNDFEAVIPRGRYRIGFAGQSAAPGKIETSGEKVSNPEPDVFDFSGLVDGSARVTLFYPRSKL